MGESRYEIGERIGASGSGTVYKGYDRQLKRHVAIKRLVNQAALPNAAEEDNALLREAGALATLRHPNIIQVFDAGSDEQGIFVVMELIEGIDLAEWLRNEGKMPLEDFLKLAEEMLEALIAAHDQSILHRAIKPKNIKVQRGPTGRIQVKLTGFGLARVSQEAMKQTVDQSGNVVGTVHYMAPEQFLRQPLDSRTDLYALGCVLYEALAGQKAFDARSIAGVVENHLKHVLTPLSGMRPDAPPALCQWVETFLSVEKADRPQDARAAMEGLRAIQALTSSKPQNRVPTAAVASQRSNANPHAEPALPARQTATTGVRTSAGSLTRTSAAISIPARRSSNRWVVLGVGVTLLAGIATLWIYHLSRTGAFLPWEPLFNGTDLTGWKSSKDGWLIQDGVVQCKPGIRGAALTSERTFKNFIVEFEFSVTDASANSGITLPNGCQPDIGPGVTGTVYMGNSGTRPPTLAKVPDLVPGEWHTYRVTVRSPRITVMVDGTTTASFLDSRAVRGPIEGILGFESNTGIRLRNARVKIL